VAALLLTPSHATAQPTVALVSESDLRVTSATARAEAISKLEAELQSNPRAATSRLEKTRLLEVLNSIGEFDTVANASLQCLNGQPDRLDRVDYFIQRRIRALLALNKPMEALAAAKSYYNVAAINSTGKAIDLVAECLNAAYPNEPAKAKRFKLQQLAGASGEDDPSLGPSVLAEIVVDPSIYDDKPIKTEHNGEWRRLGQANLLLMQDKPAEAQKIFEALTKSSNPAVLEAANESLARAAKAIAGRVGPGNEILRSLAARTAAPAAP
jgi:hypothetical protein